MKSEAQVKEFKTILDGIQNPDRNVKQWIRTLNWVLDGAEVKKE